MRSEPRIDFLLGTLLGDLDLWEEEQDRRVHTLTSTLNMNALRTSVSEGIQRQQTVSSSSTPTKTKRVAKPAKRVSIVKPKLDYFMAMELLRHPDDVLPLKEGALMNPSDLVRRFVSTTEDTPVGTLMSYLQIQLQSISDKEEPITRVELFVKGPRAKKRKRGRPSKKDKLEEKLSEGKLASLTEDELLCSLYPEGVERADRPPTIPVYYRTIP